MPYPWKAGDTLTAADLNAAIAQGLAQSTLYFVSGTPPANTVGQNQDFALDTAALKLYTRQSGTWTAMGTIMPANPPAATLPTGF